MSPNFLLCLMVTVFSAHFCAADDDCPPNSDLKLCGRKLEATCNNPYIYDLSYENKPFCEKECSCASGYVRNNSTGTCTDFDECYEELGCDSHSFPEQCAGSCEPTCKNQDLGPRCTYVLSECKVGCHCKQGYVRNEATDKCIQPRDCP